MSDSPMETKPHVLLDRECITFAVYEPDGEVARSIKVTLAELIENGNPALLLGWGILTQLTSLNLLAAQSVERVQNMPSTEEQMQRASSYAKDVLEKLGFGPLDILAQLNQKKHEITR